MPSLRLAPLPWTLTCVGGLTRGTETVAGPSKSRRPMRGLKRKLTLAGELTGDALESAYQSADLFVLPTRHEGYGMVIAEALARGTTGDQHPHRCYPRSRRREAQGLLRAAGRRPGAFTMPSQAYCATRHCSRRSAKAPAPPAMFCRVGRSPAR